MTIARICEAPLKGLTVLILLLITFIARAQTIENRTTLQLPDRSKIKLAASLEASSNLVDSSDPDHRAVTKITLKPSYLINKSQTLQVSTNIQQEVTLPQRTQLSNTSVSLIQQELKINDQLGYQPIGRIKLPTNMDDRKQNSFQGSFVIDQTLNLARNSLLLSNINYNATLIKNFHQFVINSGGEENISYVFSNSIGIDKTLFRNYTLGVNFGYDRGWTYRNRTRDEFSISETVQIVFNKNLNVLFTHTNGGDALKPNGQESNIAWFDKRSSSVSVSMNVSY